MSTKIEWTDKVWNPTTGCTKGCSYCYARTMAGRLQRMGQEKYRDGFTPVCHPGELEKPLRWKKPCRIFVNSMGDLFDPAIPFEFIDQILAIIARCPQHTFQILTKYADRMEQYFNHGPSSHCTRQGAVQNQLDFHYARTCPPEQFGKSGRIIFGRDVSWPLSNLWLGVSVEDQHAVTKRVPELLGTPSSVRFISIEPMIGPVDLERVHWPDKGEHRVDVLRGGFWSDSRWGFVNHSDLQESGLIDWVIVGGMTGKEAVPMHPDWVRSLRDQCQTSGVPFFFKQWGEWKPTASANYATGKKTAAYGKAEGRAILRDGRHVYLDRGPAFRLETIDADAENVLKAAMAANRIDPVNPDQYDWLGYHWMHKVGKKAAGSMIDGQEWKQFPEVK